MARPGDNRKAILWDRSERTSLLRSRLSGSDASLAFEALRAARGRAESADPPSIEHAFLLEWAALCRPGGVLTWFLPARGPVGDIPRDASVDGFPQRLPILCEAAASDDHEALSMALENGADPNLFWTFPDGTGGDPVFAAAAHCRTRCLSILLAAGCDPDPRSTGGVTPLMRACSSPFHGAGIPDDAPVLTVGTLLAAGADPLALDISGRGALHHAAISRKPQSPSIHAAVALLVAAGCPLSRDSSGLTPAESAVRHSNPAALAAIVAATGPDSRTLASLVEKSNEVLARLAPSSAASSLHAMPHALAIRKMLAALLEGAVLEECSPPAPSQAGHTPSV